MPTDEEASSGDRCIPVETEIEVEVKGNDKPSMAYIPFHWATRQKSQVLVEGYDYQNRQYPVDCDCDCDCRSWMGY